MGFLKKKSLEQKKGASTREGSQASLNSFTFLKILSQNIRGGNQNKTLVMQKFFWNPPNHISTFSKYITPFQRKGVMRPHTWLRFMLSTQSELEELWKNSSRNKGWSSFCPNHLTLSQLLTNYLLIYYYVLMNLYHHCRSFLSRFFSPLDGFIVLNHFEVRDLFTKL